jgi:hypothetical protein
MYQLKEKGIIFDADYDYEEEIISHPESDLGFLPPPPGGLVTKTSASCNCKQILISSLGDAQHIQPGERKY